MGYDAEDLKPNSRMTKKGMRSNSHAPLLTYEVNFDNERDVVKAYSYDDLIETISEKYNLSNMTKYRVEVWSDLYKEWLHMVSLPANRARLRILTSSGTNEPKQVFTGTPLDNCSFFSEKLNAVFKEYIHTENPNFLNHFEKAIVFGMKRHEKRNSTVGNEDVKKNESIEEVADELNNLKSENKKMMLELDKLNLRVLEIEMKRKPKNKLDKVKHCTVL